MKISSNHSATYMSDRASTPLPQFKILGQPVNLSTDYISWLTDRMQQGIGTHVVTMNAEIVIQANKDAEFSAIIDRADLVTPDGSGIIMALRLHGIEQSRCAGIDLGEELLRLAGKPESNYPVFFYGGKPEIVKQAAQNWQTELPNLNIVGIEHGYIDAQTQAKLLDRIQATQPKIILVALGMPRQEIWIRDNFHLCPEAIWIGVGGSFDVWSGIKNRAPQFVRKLDLEWLYRIAQEPSRWRRALALPQFAVLAVAERIKKLKVES
ncbi:WecB/TagA/CpsF family glycosyltransferase [Chamaesiphon sp. VAR_48_metabat_135_sub]|uniref:WecB/TagA/CpsF family glycosyltransferase n=1 Tax=Chamaesiphon sp. VAR_48_metabat_135_sub TaxID=2964699 RepID=UPI00286A0457|nr:WecB/TagA/CpsF family glycosyltransferase [Chamaesiphon sp. VAR_48_metabat_135_sub]